MVKLCMAKLSCTYEWAILYSKKQPSDAKEQSGTVSYTDGESNGVQER
jgi:hypothetical protein